MSEQEVSIGSRLGAGASRRLTGGYMPTESHTPKLARAVEPQPEPEESSPFIDELALRAAISTVRNGPDVIKTADKALFNARLSWEKQRAALLAQYWSEAHNEPPDVFLSNDHELLICATILSTVQRTSEYEHNQYESAKLVLSVYLQTKSDQIRPNER